MPSDPQNLDRPQSARPCSRPPAGIASNGIYRVALDASGRGQSSWADLRLTGGAGPHHGLRIHLRDLSSRRWWTLGDRRARGPGREGEPGRTRLDIGTGQVRLHHAAEGIETTMMVWVDDSRPVELRRLAIRNASERKRTLEVTTFVEIVLHDAAAHFAHPAFSKLFLQTEWVAPRTLLVRRRPRASDERFPLLAHAMLEMPVTGFESDRARFQGRGRLASDPKAMATPEPLTNGAGNVLDPALSLRTTFELGPGEERSLLVTFGVARDRAEALADLDSLTAPDAWQSSARGAAEQERTRRTRLDLVEDEALRLQTLAVAMMDGEASLRADGDLVARARGAVSDLSRLGLSVDRPLVFLDAARFPRALPSTLRAHSYWQALGLATQLVVKEQADASTVHVEGLHVLGAGALVNGDADRVAALASWYVREDGWPIVTGESGASTEKPEPETGGRHESGPPVPPERLLSPNRHGGFSATGDEYVISLRRMEDGSWSRPPLPWTNVIANERVGTVWSETGAGSTWSGNSREHRITPWLNDPVLDPHAEALHVRDEETGHYWSAWPGPTPDGDSYEMRHGFGYSHCTHRSEGLDQEAWVFVAAEDPVRFVVLHLTNHEARPRRLSVFWHSQLVLGTSPETSASTVLTRFDGDRDVLLASNPMAGEFGHATAFAAVVTDAPSASHRASADHEGYLGLDRDPASPRTVSGGHDLEARFGARQDPCFTRQVTFTLDAGRETRICFLLGEVEKTEELDVVLGRYPSPTDVQRALDQVRETWSQRRGAIEIRTPSAALDLMVNGWLIYQTVACRLWARSAFYQSGGAYGFRDQLQDAVALVALWPQLAREQILRHAAHQFVEGDVLHWWHPPRSRGIRTRFADDLLWLPHLTAHYLRVTGDRQILEESIPFLRARPLADGEDEAFLTPESSGEAGTLLEHCLRAIDRSLTVGAHGLPLFGSGDWNDGMNRVGREGRGESVWMGFFLFTILGEWAPWCETSGNTSRARRYLTHRERLREALNDAGWDGRWFRRGFYDDGAPLGSAESDECQIDALVQAWSVLSDAAPRERAEQSMDAVLERLVSEEDGILRLLDPPFENTAHDPGYIKGYVAGVRENGGQYTHAALWVVRALAELGRRSIAMRLLDMLNPVHHARDDQHVRRYRVEPYVVAADVYGVDPHVGRGGWTWYTGSSGWMLRVAVETILGLRVEDGDRLVVHPRIPDDWPGFRARVRPLGLGTVYEIEVQNPERAAQAVLIARLDDREMTPTGRRAVVPLSRDGQVHHLVVVLGRARSQKPPLQSEGGTP